MTKKEKLIYTAGMIDGDGHFCKPFITNGRGEKKRYPRIVVVQKDRAVIDWLKENFGGNIHEHKRHGFGLTDIWRWTLTGKKVTEMAQEMLPYLIVKREQVKRVL